MSRKNANPGKKEGAIERRQTAFELRKNGVPFRQIADRLGISEAQAFKDVQAVIHRLKELELEQLEDYRRIELERLDIAILAIASQVRSGHLGAIDRWIRLSESRRKLLGVDEASKVDLTLDVKSLSDDELYAIIAGKGLSGA